MDSSLPRWLNTRKQRSPERSVWAYTARPRVMFRGWVLLSIALPLLLLLLVPILALVLKTTPAMIVHHMGTPSVVQALTLSLYTSTVSTLVVVALGTPLAYLLVRRRFRGRRVLEVLVDIPTVLPPAVAGLALLMAFGRRGLLGGLLQFCGIEIAFTTVALVMAQIFVAAPFYVKATGVGLAAINGEIEQAAAVDGARPLQIFYHVTLPLAWRGMLGGAALGWTRALGEFGATIIFAGNFSGRTQSMPLLVYLSFELDLELALTLAVILLAICCCVLAGIRLLLRDADHEECAVS